MEMNEIITNKHWYNSYGSVFQPRLCGTNRFRQLCICIFLIFTDILHFKVPQNNHKCFRGSATWKKGWKTLYTTAWVIITQHNIVNPSIQWEKLSDGSTLPTEAEQWKKGTWRCVAIKLIQALKTGQKDPIREWKEIFTLKLY